MRTLMAVFLIGMSALAQTPEERTKQALDLVLARKYPDFYALFNDRMKHAITLETYARQADQILTLGTPQSVGEPTRRLVQGFPLVTIPIHWASTSLNFLVSWDHEGKIQGTFFRPATAPESASAWTVPEYVDTGTFT